MVTRRSGPRTDLIRFVVAPDSTLTPDLAENLPGRGLWVLASRAVVETCGLEKVVSRAARRKLSVPDRLADRLEGLLLTRCQNLLGLARRSRAAAGGFGAARDAVMTGNAALLLIARDSAGRDGWELARRAQSRSVRVSRVLDATEIGAALGRERQVYVAIGPGSLADRLGRDLHRLSGFRRMPVAGVKTDKEEAAEDDGDAIRVFAQER
ncbi:MAG: DUF448 domain-containing protein [Rhodospirillaceae bacterium]|nr:DUF448 domain-containing protein [Rhodospirillaceae bacterium]